MYFARIDKSNKVIQVIVADKLDFINQLNGDWLETTIDGSIRKNYAGKGFSYNPDLDAFIPPKPFPSWVLDNESCTFKAPVDKPNDDQIYDWNEDNQSWDLRQ